MAACGQKGKGSAARRTLLPLTLLLRGNQARQQVRLAARETAVSTSSPCLGPSVPLDIFCIFPNFRSLKISSTTTPPHTSSSFGDMSSLSFPSFLPHARSHSSSWKYFRRLTATSRTFLTFGFFSFESHMNVARLRSLTLVELPHPKL